MEIKVFVFLVEPFYFSKFHKNKVKHEKRKFNRDFLIITFEVKT